MLMQDPHDAEALFFILSYIYYVKLHYKMCTNTLYYPRIEITQGAMLMEREKLKSMNLINIHSWW